jgi:FkbM family methyltransferase
MPFDHLRKDALWEQLTSVLLNCSLRHELNNVDRLRFTPPFKEEVQNRLLDLAASVGLYRPSVVRFDMLMDIFKTPGMEQAYGLFQDQSSRDLFLLLLAYRILGHKHVRLPINDARYWKLRKSLDKYIEKSDTITQIPTLGSLDLCNVNGIRLHTHRLGLLNIFILQQYRCSRARIGVDQGDVVIDAGGCWGDATLYFAQDAAQVFCFECIPSNIAIIDKNIRLNPALGSRISVIQKALWNRSGETLVFKNSGPGSRHASDGSGIDVETQTIDDFAAANSLNSVDFIKMDIEGSELQALLGAERTIRTHRPKLAISIYHDIDHFASIPNWIAGLDLGYQFYLDHFTIYPEETVLFASTDS